MKKALAFLIILLILSAIAHFFYKEETEKKNSKKRQVKVVFTEAEDKNQKNSTPSAPSYTSNSKFEYFKFKDSYTFSIKNAVNANTTLDVSICLPQNYKARQVVKSLNYSIQPTKIIELKGNKVAYFKISNPKPQTTIEISGQIGVYTYDLNAAKGKPIIEILSPTQIKKYTSSEKNIESDDISIIKQAKALKDETDIKTVRNIYYFVQKNMRYENRGERLGAKEMLKRKKGKCTDYAALMVALCRANGIPARVICGNVITSPPNLHSWVEVYLDRYGWVTFEPTVAFDSKVDFTKIPYKYLITGKDVLVPIVYRVKLKSNTKAPKPDVLLTVQDSTIFFDENSNIPISK